METLSNTAPDSVLSDVFNGRQPGNFGWLTWAGSPSEGTLVVSLTSPGNSSTYVNPDDTSDRQINVGDWIQGKPAVSNSKKVRDALEILKATDITVPVWSETRGEGEHAAYRVSAFARVRLMSYELAGQNRITARFLGYITCATLNQSPAVDAGPDQTITLPMLATLNGRVRDDGLPTGGDLTVFWSAIGGAGTVTFSDSTAAVTTAGFSAPGTYLLRLTASDSQLTSSDEVIISVNRENSPPVASSQSVATPEDTALDIVLMGSDADGESLSFIVVENPSHGTLSGIPPNVRYTPFPDYNGPDGFTFKLNDGSLDSNVATNLIAIMAVNDPPVADSQSITNWEDTPATIHLSGGDVEGQLLKFVLSSAPTNGTLNVAVGSLSSNTLIYAPAANYNGPDGFTFRVSDGDLDSGTATIAIQVVSVNDAPLVEAGPDQRVTLPANSVQLAGTASDDFFDGSLLVVEWTKVSGPGTVTFADAFANITTAVFSTNGVYVLRFTADDLFATDSDEVTITVNAPPRISAGTDQIITFPNSVTLAAEASDDGLPTNGAFTVLWSKASGPGAVVFANPNTTNTTATFGAGGIYVLRFSASDGVANISSNVTVTVNRAPIVDAGSDLLTNSLHAPLTGTVTDDGLPEGVTVSAFWNKVSGPGDVTFDNASDLRTTASFSQPGIYVLRLSASDSLVTTEDEIRIIINVAPVVEAGADQTIVFPASAALLGAVTDDDLPSQVLNSVWTKASGPGTVTFNNATLTNATAAFQTEGRYVLRLNVSDSHLFASDEVTIDVMPAGAPQPPSVNAGPDQVVGLTNTADLAGSVAPNGQTAFAVTWKQVSGPGVAGFEDRNAPATHVNFTASGLYTLQLTASNSTVTASDDVAITVYLTNHPPIVEAGADQTIEIASGPLAPVPVSGLPTQRPKDQAGTNFWLCFPGNLGSSPEALELFISCATSATGTVSASGIGFTTNFSVVAGSVAVVSVPLELQVHNHDTNELKGIRVTADTEITVYALNRETGSAGGYLSLPTDALGTNYLVLAYGDTWVIRGSQFVVVATEDGTQVTIIPTTTTFARMVTGFRFANVPYTVTLNRGETYLYTSGSSADAIGDVTGSRITANRPIAVWGGHRCAAVPASPPCDLIVEQLPPLDSWGTSFVTMPLARRAGDTLRIMARTTNTVVSLNGVVITNLNAGRFVERIISGPARITASQPVLVAQYGHGFTYDNMQYSDSSMALVPPVDQFFSAYTVLVAPSRPTNFLNLTVPSGAVGAVTLDGLLLAATNFVSIGASGYSGAQLHASTGLHTLAASQPFGLLSYGYAFAEAYSFPAGMAVAPIARVANLTLLASAVTNRVDARQCLAATVTDQNNQPLAGIAVKFTGPNLASDPVYTAADGVARLCYRGEMPGSETITASAAGLTNSLSVVWVPQPEPPVAIAHLAGSVQDDGLPVGAGLSIAWSQLSGTSATLSSATTAVTTVRFPQSGQYRFRLSASDSDLSASDEVSLTVRFNQRPTTDAGPDSVTTGTNVVVLNGAVQDDGLPAGHPLEVFWKKVSGPGSVAFADANSASTTATFSQPGLYVLRFTAFDSEFGGRDEILVACQMAGSPNQAPMVQAPGDQTIARPQNSLSLVGVATDDGLPEGSQLLATWSQISVPGTVTFMDPSRLITTAMFPAAGYYVLRISVTDGQFSAHDDVAITVNPANTAPVVDAGADQSLSIAGTAVLTGAATDDDWPAGILTTFWSKVSGPGPVYFSTLNGVYRARFSVPGVYVLTLTASDSELTTRDEITVTVADAPPLPVAEIAAPLDGAIVTAPTTILGTADSPILQNWKLEYRLKPANSDSLSPAGGEGQGEGTAWITLAAGNVSVVNGALGVFDPTLLLNGIYELQLTVTDTASNTVTIEPLTVMVDRNMKIGHFTLSFNDLTIPVAGIPIQVIRTYDSRDKRAGDFGVGWALNLKNIRLQKNRHLGRAWDQSSSGGLFPTYCIDTARPRFITITFPDGRVHKFQMALAPVCQALSPLIYPDAIFQPLANTPGTLTPLFELHGHLVVDDQLVWGGEVPGRSDFLSFERLLNPPPGQADNILFNPDLFEFTSQEGYRYVISETNGLRSVSDPNGNTLTITTHGITWTNASGGSGLSAQFQRDDLGRITNIVDALGHAMTYRYDTNGDLVTFTDREGHTNGFTYDGRHQLLTLADARGIQAVRNDYDADGRIRHHIDALGNPIGYTHDLNNRFEMVTYRLGFVTISQYDERGNIIRIVAPDGGVTTMTYDANDNLLASIDPLGRTNTFTYDDRDNRIGASDPLGHGVRLTYNEQRRVTSATDARGNTVTNKYDAQGNLLSMRDPLGNEIHLGYDRRGLPIAMTNALGHVMRFTYDAWGRLTNEVDVLGHATGYMRDTNGSLLAQTTTRTRSDSSVETLTVSMQYDRLNRLTNTIFPDHSHVQTIYNAMGTPAVTIDQIGRQTFMDYDERGRPVRTTYPDGTSESSAYDPEGRRIAFTNRLGQATEYDFDAVGRPFRTVHPDGVTTTNYFDLAGQLRASTDTRGFNTFYGYDARGRNTSVTNALLQASRSRYDEADNLIAAIDALGRTNRFLYDALNRRTNTVFADGSTAATLFDELGRRIAEIDPNTNITAFGYDARGRLRFVTNALGKITEYRYNELGQQTHQVDANHHITTLDYDPLGRRVLRTLPGGQFESYGYNLAGLLTSKTDFNQRTTTFLYDVMNRLTNKIPDATTGEPAVGFVYNALGQRTNMVDASGSTRYRYNVRNRLVEKVKTWAAVGLSVALSYAYDAGGNVTNLGSSSVNGTAVAYEYDPLNRLSAVSDTRLGRTTYAYDDVGNLRSCALPNGLGNIYGYDSRNRLTNLTASSAQHATVAQYRYTLGPAGHRLTAVETVVQGGQPQTINRLFNYDATYRLLGETIDGGHASATYTYDDVGNRLARTTTGFPAGTSFTYDANDRLNTDTYDNNGNTLLGAGFNQTQADRYDFENRLIQRRSTLHSQQTTISLGYDGDGHRVSKSVNDVTTFYLVDDLNPTGHAQVLEELAILDPPSSVLAVSRTYTCGHDLLGQDQLVHTGTNLVWSASFYGYDGHGSVRYLTDLSGAVTDTYDYDAFGNLIAQTGSTPNLYLYSGEQFDPDLGLYYLRARYHNPQTGRFWSMDSFEGFGADPGSLHKYTYCANEPVNCRDPSGHTSLPELNATFLLGLTTRTFLSATLGGMTGSLTAGYDSILHGRVSNTEIDSAMQEGFVQGVTAGAFFGFTSSFGVVGTFGTSAIGLIYSGFGFLAAYQSYLDGYEEAGDFELILAGVGTVLSVSGLTQALTQHYSAAINPVAPYQRVLNRLDSLDFSTPTGKAIFYSGPDQGKAAIQFARATGGQTLEMTPGGRALLADPDYLMLSTAQRDFLWQRASARFAAQASGEVRAFVRGARQNRTYRSIEEPVLRTNPKVTTIQEVK